MGTTRLSGDAGCPPGTRGTGSHQPGPLLPPDSGLGLPHPQTRLVQGSLQAGRLGYCCKGPRVEVPGGGGQGRTPVRVWLFSGSLGPRDAAVCPRLGVDERPGALPAPSCPSLSCCSAFIPPPSHGSHRVPGTPRVQLPPPSALHGPWGCSPSLLSAWTPPSDTQSLVDLTHMGAASSLSVCRLVKSPPPRDGGAVTIFTGKRSRVAAGGSARMGFTCPPPGLHTPDPGTEAPGGWGWQIPTSEGGLGGRVSHFQTHSKP